MNAKPRALPCLAVILASSLAVATNSSSKHRDVLAFAIRPVQASFKQGVDVVLEFSLKNLSECPVLAIREASLHDLIYLAVVDKAGRQVAWHGKVISRAYPANFFVILQSGESTTFRAVINLPDGGYDLRKTGTYRVRAEFSISPKAYFEPVAEGAVIPDQVIRSNWVHVVITSKTGRK